MSHYTLGSCPMGRSSRSRVVWRFEALDSPTGGGMDVDLWRRVDGEDRLLCSTHITHYSLSRRRDMRRAALGAAAVELRRLARWATERAEAIEAGGRS